MTVEPVTVHALIGAPDMYDGVHVRVVGFCSFEFEGNAIWATEEHYSSYITKNAIWLKVDGDVDLTGYHEKVLLIEGVFSAQNLGHKGMFSGAIETLNRVEPYKG